MAGPKQRKKLTGVELARKRQPTGRLLADVLRKSKKDTDKYEKYKKRGLETLKEAKKKALPPQLRKPGKPTGRTLAKVLKKKKS